MPASSNDRVIPLVDLSQFDSADKREGFVKELSEAFHNIGFVGVVNHGIDPQLIRDFYKEAEAFFALPKETKLKYEIPDAAGQRGYTSFGREQAKDSKVADLKEFYQIGQESLMPNPNLEDAPKFMELGRQLYVAFEHTATKLMSALALHLNLPEHYFEPETTEGNSILRAIHYPPITTKPESAVRAAQHEDINLITLLVGASAGGLQLLGKNGEWQEIVAEKGEIVVNIGDFLQRLTNKYFVSTTHRVVNPPEAEWDKPRLSIPFFFHPKPTTDLSVLPCCITEQNPCQFAPITAGEYLNERLREIGLKK